VPFEHAANGKVFLAYGTPPPKKLAQVRARGFATSIDELELGLSALAAPVFGPRGEALAALSISGPSARLTSERIGQLAPLLIAEANTLAERLGHRDHTRGAA
jgi:DNA-binding IclR family transcriptional regulator